MKSRILIVEPSEMILHGLTAMLKNLNYKVLEPRRTAATLDNDLSVLRPEILIINPTLCAAPMQLAQGRSMKVAALVYQYIEQSILNQYDAIIDVRDSANVIESRLVQLLSQPAVNQDKKTENYDLTKRETAVLVEVAKGLTNKEIADALNLSVHTVISHRKNIMHKTGIKSVAGLTVYAMLNNLID